eukprot:jgi/Bigna1/59429/fgenesh1_kg.4_\
MPTQAFGWVAVALSLTYKFPQIWKLYKTKDTRGISVLSQLVQASAYGFYIVHGILIEDHPIVFLGVTSLLQSIILVVQYFCYRGHHEKQYQAENSENDLEFDDVSNRDQETILSVGEDKKFVADTGVGED